MAKKEFNMKELVETAFDDSEEDVVEEDVVEDETEETDSDSSREEKQSKEEDDISIAFDSSDNLWTEDPNWKGYKYFQLVGVAERVLCIKFSKYFKKESEEYENFITSCMAKKAYHKLMHLFCHTANAILNRNSEATQAFLYKYYCIKRDLDNGIYNNDANFNHFILTIVALFDVSIMNEIRKYVLSQYVPTETPKFEENKHFFIESITFTPYHIKILYVLSRMIHLIAPLCLEYLRNHPRIDAKNFLGETFKALFNIAESYGGGLIKLDNEDRKTDVYQKLYSFVEAKVESTLKSDKPQWDRQTFFGVIWKSTCEFIVNKLIIDIIPEFSFCGNVMHMVSAVTRKSIQDYTFRKKDSFSISSLVDVDANSSDDDNSVISEAEQFDSFNSKHDAFSIYLRHTFTEDTVNKIIERKGIIISPDDVDYYMKNIHFHKFQTFAIFSSVISPFGGTENIYSLNQENYIKLMLMVSISMRQSGLTLLSNYVTGIKNRHYISKKESRVSHSLLVQDPLYNYIINTKYSNVKNIIAKKNNFIESKISYLINNEFLYNLPNSQLTNQIIPRNEDVIRNEVLRFFSEFIC